MYNISSKRAHNYQLSLHYKQNQKHKLADNNKLMSIYIWT